MGNLLGCGSEDLDTGRRLQIVLGVQVAVVFEYLLE
jgi:hypothetical protein